MQGSRENLMFLLCTFLRFFFRQFSFQLLLHNAASHRFSSGITY
jgi:hypothetical protein